jgi:predicted AAA+ superfamily ATPase
METWWNYFFLKFDPLSTSPLSRESQKILLYKTKDISEKIDTEIFGLENSLQFIRLLVGPRGIGKTTVLHYIQQEARKISSIKSMYPLQK